MKHVDGLIDVRTSWIMGYVAKWESLMLLDHHRHSSCSLLWLPTLTLFGYEKEQTFMNTHYDWFVATTDVVVLQNASWWAFVQHWPPIHCLQASNLDPVFVCTCLASVSCMYRNGKRSIKLIGYTIMARRKECAIRIVFSTQQRKWWPHPLI